MKSNMNMLTMGLSTWFAVITVAAIALFIVVYKRFERKKDDEKELISEFDAESCVTGVTSPNVVKLDLDFAASTKHFGGTPSPAPSPPRPDEDGLDAPAIQLMMENSGHTLVTSSSSSPSVHPSAPAQTSSTSASSSKPQALPRSSTRTPVRN